MQVRVALQWEPKIIVLFVLPNLWMSQRDDWRRGGRQLRRRGRQIRAEASAGLAVERRAALAGRAGSATAPPRGGGRANVRAGAAAVSWRLAARGGRVPAPMCSRLPILHGDARLSGAPRAINRKYLRSATRATPAPGLSSPSQVPEVARAACRLSSPGPQQNIHQQRPPHAHCTSSGALVMIVPGACWSTLTVSAVIVRIVIGEWTSVRDEHVV